MSNGRLMCSACCTATVNGYIYIPTFDPMQFTTLVFGVWCLQGVYMCDIKIERLLALITYTCTKNDTTHDPRDR